MKMSECNELKQNIRKALLHYILKLHNKAGTLIEVWMPPTQAGQLRQAHMIKKEGKEQGKQR